jgi:hypothetical protein
MQDDVDENALEDEMLRELYELYKNSPTALGGWRADGNKALHSARIRIIEKLQDEQIVTAKIGGDGWIYGARITPHGYINYKTRMETGIPRMLSHGSVQILDLVSTLNRLDEELVVRAGADGNLYLAHRMTPQVVVARIRLDGENPSIDKLGHFPGLMKRDS